MGVDRHVPTTEMQLLRQRLDGIDRRARLQAAAGRSPTVPRYDPDFPLDGVEGQIALHTGDHTPPPTNKRPWYYADGDWHPFSRSLIGADYVSTILLSPTLISYWPLDEAAGNAIDHGPHGYDLTAIGTIVYQVAGYDAIRLPYGVRMNGVNHAVPLTDDSYTGPAGLNAAAGFAGHSAFTAECWVKPGVQPVLFTGLLCHTDGGAPAVEDGWKVLCSDSNEIVVARCGGGGNDIAIAPVALTSTDYTYVAVTYDGADIRIYYDGTLVLAQASAQSQGVGSGFILGAGLTNGGALSEHYIGDIQHCALYSSALTDQEILEHWASAGGITEDGVGAVTTVVIADHAVTPIKLNSGTAAAGEAFVADGAGGATLAYPKIDVLVDGA
jgi:hypothetical protein